MLLHGVADHIVSILYLVRILQMSLCPFTYKDTPTRAFVVWYLVYIPQSCLLLTTSSSAHKYNTPTRPHTESHEQCERSLLPPLAPRATFRAKK